MISPASASGELVVAKSLAAIEPAFTAMIEIPSPGFQIAPDVDTDESLRILQGLMRRHDPTFSFNDIGGRRNPDTVAIPHYDEYYARRMAGIAVNVIEEGEGDVALQLLGKDVVVDREELTPGDFIGPCLRGETMPGMKTVFSERIYVPEHGVILGATYHYFGTRGDTPRKWLRYTFAGH